jgi:hypothetical protein
MKEPPSPAALLAFIESRARQSINKLRITIKFFINQMVYFGLSVF